MTLNREQLLARDDRPVKIIRVGEDEVGVRILSLREVIELEEKVTAAGEDRAKVAAVQMSVLICDEKGERILTVDDAVLMLNQSPALATAVSNAGKELNGWGDVKGN